MNAIYTDVVVEEEGTGSEAERENERIAEDIITTLRRASGCK